MNNTSIFKKTEREKIKLRTITLKFFFFLWSFWWLQESNFPEVPYDERNGSKGDAYTDRSEHFMDGIGYRECASSFHHGRHFVAHIKSHFTH